MNINKIESHTELLEKLKEKSFVFIYKSGSELSECALKNIRSSEHFNKMNNLFLVDVNEVKDVHPHYNIHSVPSLLVLENKLYVNVIKGCMDRSYYDALFGEGLHVSTGNGKEKRVPKIVLYSTPTCSWCRTIKSYFKKQQVKFREIDVSQNEQAAREMVNKSGQQGVPQTEIDGEIVVGFDQKKIDRLLGIV